MEKVEIIDPCIDPRWDKFVENHPFGWIVHLSGWKTVLETAFPHMQGHYYALIDSESNIIKAALPVFEVRSWLTGNRLVSIPYATLCDPLISTNEQFEILLNEILNYAKIKKLHPINVRLFHARELLSKWNSNISSSYKTHLLPLEKDPDATKNKFNRNIRRIIKTFDNHALTLRIGNAENDILNFYRLYSQTRKRLGLPTQPYRLLQELFHTYAPSNHLSLLLAETNNKVIGGLIVYKYKNRVSSEFLASEIEYRNLNTDHFLYWHAIRMSCEEGYKIYDFGRTAINNISLSDFKRRWGTDELELPEYYTPRKTQREGTHTYKLAQNLCKNAPEPLFHALSKFCYRHLG